MANKLFVSYWALVEDGHGLPSFMGNQEVQWKIDGMKDIELLERYIKKTLHDNGIDVSSVTIINWKAF